MLEIPKKLTQRFKASWAICKIPTKILKTKSVLFLTQPGYSMIPWNSTKEMNTLKASGITSENAVNEDEAAQSTKEEEKEDGNADNDDDYELPEKTEEELGEEARTEPNTAEIQHLMWLSELKLYS